MAYDIYYNKDLHITAKGGRGIDSLIGAYYSQMNLSKEKGTNIPASNKTYDDTIREREVTCVSLEEAQASKNNGSIAISDNTIKRWGIGFTDEEDYRLLDDHYKLLKKQNPNCDNNQEIFIKDLCFVKLKQMAAFKESKIDDFKKLTELYRDTFKQAGLKTIQDSDASNDEVLGVTLSVISQYTPEEYYKDKKLYKDFDWLGNYIERFITRPLKNLQFGSKDRDSEYCVKDSDDEYDE